jgi:hypothetical protein
MTIIVEKSTMIVIILIVLPIKINTTEPKHNPHGGGRDVCVL